METFFPIRYQQKCDLFPDPYSKVNNRQISYIIFVQNPASPNEVHVRATYWFNIGFAKAKAIDSIIRYSGLSKRFSIIGSQLAPLKQKYKDFASTWFWEFKTKNVYSPWFTAQRFHDELFGDVLYNTSISRGVSISISIPRRVFKYKDKNLRKNFEGFLNCTVTQPDITHNTFSNTESST